MFKVGDKVFDPALGIGVLHSDDFNCDWKYNARFDKIYRSYTKDFRTNPLDKFPSLMTLEEGKRRFPERFPKEPVEVKVRWELEPGYGTFPIQVWDDTTSQSFSFSSLSGKVGKLIFIEE